MNQLAPSTPAVRHPGRSLGTLLVGVAWCFAFLRFVLAAVVLTGLASFPNAHPGLNAAPLNHLLGYGLLTALLLLIYRRIGE